MCDFSMLAPGVDEVSIGGVAGVIFLADDAPFILREVREFSVAVIVLVDDRQIQAIGLGQGLAVDFTPPDDENLVDAVFLSDVFRGFDGFIDAGGGDQSVGGRLGVAADDDVGAFGQGFAAQRVPGLAAHDDRFAQRRAFEIFEIFRDVPRDLVALPDDVIFGHGRDGGDFDIAHNSFIR